MSSLEPSENPPVPTQSNIIPISEIYESFQDHLKIDKNDRIIFSGRFGSGKTSFLNTFFEENADYIPIFLYPVNYSVASNEDIFELIKYDILIEILSNEKYQIELESLDFSEMLTFQSMILSGNSEIKEALEEAGKEAAKKLIENIPIVGKSIVDFTDIGWDLFKKIRSAHNNYHTKITEDDGDKIEDFKNKIRESRGNIYEKDIITQIIIKFISQLKQIPIRETEEKKKQIVLIIDDLDRIDPEHIFRLLNIFSAHVDERFSKNTQSNFKNKFNFDKIILSCDIKNIRNIFSARYGQHTHFSGYIDKFYSVQIFNFSLAPYAEEVSRRLLTNIKAKNIGKKPDGNPFKELPLADAIQDSYYESFDYLLVTLIEYDLISIRDINKLSDKYMTFPSTKRSDDVPVLKIDQFAVIVIDFLRLIYSSDEEIENMLLIADRLFKFKGLNYVNIHRETLGYIIGNYCYLKRFPMFRQSEYRNNSDLKGTLNWNGYPYTLSATHYNGSSNSFNIDQKILSGSISFTTYSGPETPDHDPVKVHRNLEPTIFWFLNECRESYR
ncbi:hypothetical protein BWI96_16725 [Siphonobacter sp. SORGH_AS_0500]|uniref:P-loop NTPase fold protein n=1 Tax=Siphonobacter sp. SORGH_AS_0500 TaxID=1864824 RepID=UPI000CA87941|nr:P-loop NTPase fold protein [Siphonobacter sp. SORGH_AS_0500]PKK35543.1 hypothetical protein BWI96_16725 [Siphonobacter sp. SORGH_AS_0500]